jgi:hypothetical protein
LTAVAAKDVDLLGWDVDREGLTVGDRCQTIDQRIARHGKLDMGLCPRRLR